MKKGNPAMKLLGYCLPSLRDCGLQLLVGGIVREVDPLELVFFGIQTLFAA